MPACEAGRKDSDLPFSYSITCLPRLLPPILDSCLVDLSLDWKQEKGEVNVGICKNKR